MTLGCSWITLIAAINRISCASALRRWAGLMMTTASSATPYLDPLPTKEHEFDHLGQSSRRSPRQRCASNGTGTIR